MQTRLDKAAARRAAIVLCAIGGMQAVCILAFPRFWLSPTFRDWNAVGAGAWVTTAVVTIAYISYSVRGLPTVAALLARVSPFKLFTFVIAIPASIVEEVLFRHYLMNVLAGQHLNVELQVLASGVAFGAVHVFWGIRGGMSAVIGAVSSTTLLGLALAVVFVMAGRVVFPCVVSHLVVNLVLEPWLLYAYIVRARSRKTVGSNA